jgi:energy-coupling factor transport system ATP-binding protein
VENKAIISLRDVTFTYEGGINAISNVNITIQQGEFVVVLGPNGAGKSTLCYLLSGIVPHIYGGRRRGLVSVVGLDPWDQPLYVTAQHCGVLMQDPEVQLFMPTLKSELAFGPSNLGVPREKIFERSQEALSLVRLEGFEEHNPRDLSGGQKQRAALASVLTMQPQVLILDEPTSQLDPAGRWEVGEAIERLKKTGELTIVMTTHETEEILHLADQVLVLEGGKTVLHGSPRFVFSQSQQLDKVGVKTPSLISFQTRLFFNQDKYVHDINNANINLTINDVSLRVQQAVELGKIEVREVSLDRQSVASENAPLILEAKSLTVKYPGPPSVTALDGINTEIRMGEMIGIVGQNGSGKSTLVKCLVGLLKPFEGEVLFRGENIRKYSVGEMAKRVGLVLQNPDYQLFTTSCHDEVQFGLININVPEDEMEKLVAEALQTVGLFEEADLFPFRLSFGDRRKLAVAATMALNPEVLILDEPTTAQDHKGRYQLADLAKKFHDEKNGTVIMITHDVDLVANYADRLMVLHNGKILLDGATADVFSQEIELKKSFVVPPVAAQLARKLTSIGVMPTVMTLEELYKILVPKKSNRKEG